MKMHFAHLPQVQKTIRGAQREIFLTLPENCTWDEPEVDVIAAHDVTGKDLLVHIFIPPASAASRKESEAGLVQLAKSGVEIWRTLERVPRMALVDRRFFIIARNQTDYSDGALIGRDLPFTPMIAQSLARACHSDTDRTRPACDPGSLPPDPLSREVLRQLARGTKDEAAAREMGMALRTYRRVVARLMGQLDARSRFQAGYAAAQRRWL